MEKKKKKYESPVLEVILDDSKEVLAVKGCGAFCGYSGGANCGGCQSDSAEG